MHPLKRPRRIVTALLIFAVLAGGGVVGVVMAQDELQAPTHFTFAAPKEGDRGVYEVEGSDFWSRAARESGEFRFELRNRSATVDASGQPRLVDEFSVNDTRYETEYAWDWPIRHAFQLDAVTGKTFATIDEWTDLGDGDEQGDARAVYLRDGQTPVVQPCGLRTPLQGATLAVGDESPLPQCFGTRFYNVETSYWQTVDIIDANGTRVELWQTTPDRTGTQAHANQRQFGYAEYAVGIPYPVFIEIWDRYDPQDIAQTWRLTGYEPGDAALVDPPLPAPVVPTTAPRTPWMFDETGIDHPFPLSEAVQAAMNDPVQGTAAFLQAHPEAYIVDVSYWEFVRDGGVLDHQWRITWRDADELHAVDVSKRSGEAVDPARDALAALTGQQTGPYTVSEGNPRSLETFGPFYPPPESLPTVASMWAYYDAWARPSLREKGPNMWEITILGGDEENRVIIEAGRFQDRPQPAAPDGVDYSRDWAFLEYEWQQSELPFRYSDRGFIRTTEPTSAAPAPEWKVAAVSSSPLNGLGAEATAIGAGAMLAALGYYLWPLAKTGALGLFSRVRQDKVLDNPTRRRIHEYITANPGCHYHAIIRALGISKGTAQHHLARLEQTGHVTSAKSGGYRCFFVRGERDHSAMQAQGVLKSDVAKGILQACRLQPGITTGALAAELSVTPATVSYHLRRLRSAGLIASEGRGHGATEAGQAA